jgi:hypothetical protein
MPHVFDKLGVRFAYPDSWSLEEQELPEASSVTVSSPGGAFWWLAVHPGEADLAAVARAVMQGFREEYADVDIEAVAEEVDDQELIGYDVNFYCLDLTTTAQIRGFRAAHATYMMLWQAEDREFELVRPVFAAITASLIRTASRPRSSAAPDG